MALQYFLYDITYGNTIIDRSSTSFLPIPPYYELHTSYFIPDIQPLYLYRVTGTTIFVNSQSNVDNYLNSIKTIPSSNGNVNYGEFTGYTKTTGLQEITEVNAGTNVESSFNGGIVVNKIRPSGDTTTAIQINKANGISSIVNIDTLSGYTGFGTTSPKGLVHAYGVNQISDPNGTESNAYIIDGMSDVDKDIQWAENGVPKWLAETYRGEDAKYWYLYNIEDNNAPIVASNTGRIGINTVSSVVNYHAILKTGSPNDVTFSGIYELNYSAIYEIIINATGATDTYIVRKTYDNGITYTDWSLSSGCTTGATSIGGGVFIQFDNVSGHELGTAFVYVASAQLPMGTFIISPPAFTEVQQTIDYNESPIIYEDITGNANNNTLGGNITIFNTGTTNNALYLGTQVKGDGVYINIHTPGNGVNLYAEYWNGTSWNVITNGIYNDTDTTLNLTKSGGVTWDSTLMNGWIRAYMPDLVEPGYELYWVRLITSTSPAIAPIASSFARGGNYRFGLLASPNDVGPSFYVDSVGRTNIGGGNITGSNKLQVNSASNLQFAAIAGGDSLVEFDSDNSSLSTLRLKQASDTVAGTSLEFARTRGTLNCATSLQRKDVIGTIDFKGKVGTSESISSQIYALYTGDGSTTRKSDLVFGTACGTCTATATEKVRITSSGTTGFGTSSPTAMIHIASGNTCIAPLKFTQQSSLVNIPKSGNVEYNGNNWFGTTSTDARKTFAFLESPSFSGMPNFPSGTTFAQGLATCSIRPLIDGAEAIHIHKADNITPVVSVNTISGFTGFGISPPQSLVNLYGCDNSMGDGWNYQTNSVRIDGNFDSDKDLQWFTEGHPAFTAQIYRCENGRFWYLSSPQSQSNQLTISDSGRVGINNQTNIMNYHALLEAGGPNDMNVGGIYTQDYVSVYEIEIDSLGGLNDGFKWRKSNDNGQTFGSWSLSSGCTTGVTTIDNGITVQFENTTGHTLYTNWKFGAFPQLPIGTFVVTPNAYEEVQTTHNYNGNPIVYDDITANANTSTSDLNIAMFATGTTSNAIYFGSLSKLNSTYINLLVFGVGISLIVEYWNGTIWTDITQANNSYNDGTNNLTQSGNVTWETSTMADWILSYMTDLVQPHYELYWIRMRTTTSPTVAPVVNNFARNGNYRIAVFRAPNDYKPSFYVDSIGRTNIGGGNITGKNVFQINNEKNLPASSSNTLSLVELDSQDSCVVDLKIKLSSNDALSGGITIVKTRGCLGIPTDTCIGDSLGHIDFRGRFGSSGALLSRIESKYENIGVGSTHNGDLLFSTASDSVLSEKVRINSSGYTGFGISSPTASIHIASGNTAHAPMMFTSGTLKTTPVAGSVEFSADSWYGTISTGNARRTFAFLENPSFSGNVSLPISTTYNAVNLCNFILNSGGTNNSCLIKRNTFCVYTGTTVPNTYQTISNVSHYTGITAPNTYYTKSQINVFTGTSVPILGSSVTGVTNGITKLNSHNIVLGGNLTQNTLITGNTFNFGIGANALNLYASNGINICDTSNIGININTNSGNVNLRGYNSLNVEKTKMSFSDTLVSFTDNRTTTTGLEYHADYSAGYSSRSLVDKGYVDSIATGLNLITSVLVASTGNIGLSGLTIIDGIQLVNGNRVLAKNQNNGVFNGIYTATGGTWQRASDYVFTLVNKIHNGDLIPVTSGNTNGNTIWALTTQDPIATGDTLTFSIYSKTSSTIGGNGICVTQSSGNYNVAVKLAPSCGLCVDNSGVYTNPAIAGTGLSYNSGILSVCGSNLAGNSISWTGNTFNVNPSIGTLNTALNNKTNITLFDNFTGTTQNIYNSTFDPTGFINNDNIVVTYNQGARTVTLSAITGTIQYYWRGILHTLGTSWTSTAHSNTTQGWYLYSTDGTNINWSNTSWQFSDLQVASKPPYVDFGMREVHGLMPYGVHDEFHTIVGTYADSGFGLTAGSYALQPTSPTNTDNTPAFDSGKISDEDLDTDIALWSKGAYTLAYFTGTTNPTFITGSSRIFRLGSTYPYINTWNGNSFNDIEMVAGQFANWYVFRVPTAQDVFSQTYRLFILQPQYSYPTLIAAQGEVLGALNINGIRTTLAEFVPVERITMGTSTAYSGATGKVRIEAEGVLTNIKFGQVGNVSNAVSTTAFNVSVTPTVPFTSNDMQNLSTEYANAINNRLHTSTFSTYTGTTVPNTYYTKSQINTYTGTTQTTLSRKAYLSGATFTGVVNVCKPTQNDNSSCVATTSWYIGQCGNATPLINNGNGTVGTSTLWSHQDHVHPTDTTRLARTTFSGYTGTTVPNTYQTISNLSHYTGSTVPNTYQTISNVSHYTGTTAPSTYYTKPQINIYTGATQSALNNKAFLSGATFTGVVNVCKPTQNDNTACVATTSWYISQGSTSFPLINGIAAYGISNLFARQDHVHPTDTTRLARTTFSGYTGTTAPNTYQTISNVSHYTGTTAPAQFASKSFLSNYTGSTVPNTYQTISNVTHYTGTTAPNTYQTISNVSRYTGTTAPAQFASKSFLSNYTGSTVPNTYQTISNVSHYTGTTAPNTYYNKTQINTYTGVTQTTLSRKAYLSGATFTGIVNVVKPSLNDNSTCVPTTSWYYGQSGTTSPLMDGIATVGNSSLWSHQNHVHPSDTSRLTITTFSTYTGTTVPNTYAPLASPTFTGTVRSVTPTANNNSTCIATTGWYFGQSGSTTPLMNGIAVAGNSLLWSHQDHIHPRDTSKLSLSGGTMIGALTVNSNTTITGTTILRGTTCLGTPSVGDITTDRTLFWNPTTCSVNASKLTGGSDSYFYIDKTTIACSTGAGTVMYLSGTPWTFKAGRYTVDFNAQYGNSTAAGNTCVQFAVDGTVIGTCYQEGGEVNSWVASASLSRDITLTAACHCLTIQFGRGANTACMTYGMIRAKRIC